jgi:transcriptional regulator with XRE-family HTH domain
MKSAPGMLNQDGRHLLGQLRMLRDKVGLTQEEAGHALGWSRYRVGRMERGRLPEYDILRAALQAYRVPEKEQSSYLQLWERSRNGPL